MTKPDGRGRPPAQADVGQRLTLRNDRGARYHGILKTLTRSGTAIILCLNTDYGGVWVTYSRPELAIVTGAEVLVE